VLSEKLSVSKFPETKYPVFFASELTHPAIVICPGKVTVLQC